MEIIFLVVVGAILFSLNREIQGHVEEAVADPEEPPIRKAMASGYGGCFGLAMLGLFGVVVALVVGGVG